MKNHGQISIEFLLTFIMAFGFVVLFLYYSMNLATGYIAHYATFVASRAYLTGDHASSQDIDQGFLVGIRKGEEAFETIPLKSLGIDGDIKFNAHPSINASANKTDITEFFGAYFLFSPPFKIATDSKKNKLLSESFLGKEPTRADCECQIRKAMGFSKCEGEDINEDVTLYDNGC